MNIYVELKQTEKNILEEIKKLKDDNISLFEQLKEYSKEYPNEFRVLPKNLDTFNYKKSDIRLEILKDEINDSSMPEEVKETIFDLIKNISKTVEENNIKEAIFKEELSINSEKIKKVESYLHEKRKIVAQNDEKIDFLEKKTNEYEKIINNEIVDEEIKDLARKLIMNIDIERNALSYENNRILSDEKIREDLELILEYKKEENEEEKENKAEISLVVEKDAPTLEDTTPIDVEFSEVKEEEKENNEKSIISIVEEVKKEEANDEKEENTKAEEIDDKKDNSISKFTSKLIKGAQLKENNSKKVVNKKEASPELVKKLKTGGKIALGVLTIGAAVAAILTNPLALGTFVAGGVLVDQAKEKVLKK